MKTSLVQRIKYSSLGRLAALPMRLRLGAAPILSLTRQVLRWLVHSREWANFSYDYAPEGMHALVGAIAELTGRSHAEIRAYADELQADAAFAQRYRQRVTQTRLRHICDPTLHFGRCLANYMLVRASGARVVFEAGTERGLSSWAMCRALQHNGHAGALLITVDIHADRGEFLEGDEGGLVRRVIGDSVAALRNTAEPIDFFLHDTVSDPVHSRTQFAALEGRLAPGALVYCGWFINEFVDFCERNDLRYLEYVERVRDHWYPGRRAGLAVRRVGPPAPR